LIEFTLLWQLEMRNRDHRITFFLEDVIKAINGSHFCEPGFQRTPGRLAVGRPVSQRLKNRDLDRLGFLAVCMGRILTHFSAFKL